MYIYYQEWWKTFNPTGFDDACRWDQQNFTWRISLANHKTNIATVGITISVQSLPWILSSINHHEIHWCLWWMPISQELCMHRKGRNYQNICQRSLWRIRMLFKNSKISMGVAKCYTSLRYTPGHWSIEQHTCCIEGMSVKKYLVENGDHTRRIYRLFSQNITMLIRKVTWHTTSRWMLLSTLAHDALFNQIFR